MPTMTAVAISLALSTFAQSSGDAPCAPTWRMVDRYPLAGFGLTPRAGVMWDPDGASGPREPALLLGFQETEQRYVGPSSHSGVYMLENGRWVNPFPLDLIDVRSMTMWRGELVIAGRVREGGVTSSYRVAVRRGDRWETIPFQASGATQLLEIAGDLYALWGNAVSRWDGQTATDVSPPPSVVEHRIQSFAGKLIAVTYRNAGGNRSTPAAVWIRENEQWRTLVAALPEGTTDVREFNGHLHAAGLFPQPPTLTRFATVARLEADGRWTPVVWHETIERPRFADARLAEYQGRLAVIGSVSLDVPDSKPVPISAVVSPDATIPLGNITSGGFGYLLGGERLFALGNWANLEEPVLKVAEWTGAQWEAPGDGFNAPIWGLHAGQTSLYAAGSFTKVPGARAPRVARWDAASGWSPLGTGLSGAPPGEECRARAVVEIGASVYVGGLFNSAGGTPALNIARWDGVNWWPLGPGLNGEVRALAEFEGDLIAGGKFTGNFNARLGGVARWNGSSWVQMSNGVNGEVLAVEATPLGLVVGGAFRLGDNPSQHAAIWNAGQWRPMGAGPGLPVTALEWFRGEVLAGLAVGQQAERLKRWSGTAWESHPEITLSEPVRAILELDDRLYIATRGFADTVDDDRGMGADDEDAESERTGGGRLRVFSGEPLRSGRSLTPTSETYATGIRALARFGGELHVGGGFAAETRVAMVHARVSPIEPIQTEFAMVSPGPVWPRAAFSHAPTVTGSLPYLGSWIKSVPYDFAIVAVGPVFSIPSVRWSDQGRYQGELWNGCSSSHDLAYLELILMPDFDEDGVISTPDLVYVISRLGQHVGVFGKGAAPYQSTIDLSSISFVLRHFGAARPR